MRKRLFLIIALSTGLLAACLLLSAFALRGPVGLPRAHLRIPFVGPIALAPEVAARDMLRNRGRIEPFQVQSSRPWPGGRLVVYHYSVTPPGEPPHMEFGFALVELRRGGWSVFDGIMHRSLPQPATVTYASVERNGTLLVYGQPVDPRVAAIEVRANIGRVVRTRVSNGGFVVLVPGAQSIGELRAHDRQGRVLQGYQAAQQILPDQ